MQNRFQPQESEAEGSTRKYRSRLHKFANGVKRYVARHRTQAPAKEGEFTYKPLKEGQTRILHLYPSQTTSNPL